MHYTCVLSSEKDETSWNGTRLLTGQTRASPMFKNILVPTDGSAPSRKAIRRAVQLAKEQRARITGFYVGPVWQLPIHAEYVPVEVLSPKAHAAAVKRAAARILRVVKKIAAAARVPCRCSYVMAAHPYAEIIKTARRGRCDLIVMGCHGRRGISRLLLGSVTGKVLAHSKVPVLVSR